MPKYEFDTARWLRNVAEVQSHRAGAGAAMLRENMLKCAEELSALRARVARLEEALMKMLPPEHGEYGGPLVEMVARYEDGSPTGRITPLLAKMHIGHEAVTRARRALEDK